jgi:hypothetical protein
MANIHREGAAATPETRTIVLVTGDGNTNEGHSDFVECVGFGVSNGWSVEIWSWKSVLSNRLKELAIKHENVVSLVFLDDYREALVPSS